MSVEEKISNIFLAFKFALLDSLYSKTEIIEIIRSNGVLLKKVQKEDLNEDSLKEIVEKYLTKGNITESSKILFELIHKKIMSEDGKTRPWAILKTIDTMPWLNGLEKSKGQEIQSLIEFFEEVENSEYTPAVMECAGDCVRGYEEYDIETYLVNIN